jgi:hypothetical protein
VVQSCFGTATNRFLCSNFTTITSTPPVNIQIELNYKCCEHPSPELNYLVA